MLKKSQLPLILITAFLDILGMSLFIPLLPTIITGFGADASWTGYTQAVYAIGMFIGGLFFGKLSDKYGRKRMLSFTSIINLVSYIIMLISVWSLTINIAPTHAVSETPSIGFAHLALAFQGLTPIFLLFLLARFVGGLGGAGFGVIQAYIADISNTADRVKNMGYMGAAFGIAFLIGPAVAALLYPLIGIHNIIIMTCILISLNVFSIWVFLEEPRKHVDTQKSDTKKFQFSQSILVLLFLSFGSMLAFSAIQSMSTQFYTDRFFFTPTQIGYTLALVGFISVIYQGWLIKYVLRRFDEYAMLRIAYIILIIGFFGFAMNQSPYWLFLWVIFFPLGMGSFQPPLNSLLSKSAGKEVGKVMGYNTSVQSIGNILGPILAGVLYAVPGSGLPFYTASAIAGVLLIVSLRLKK